MPTHRSALLIMPPGAARRAAKAALEERGLSVREAREPYAAALSLSERGADLVVLDLEVYRARDGAFLRALKRRAPSTRVLLLLPEGRRRVALGALKAGADAYVLEPFDPDELGQVALGLLAGAAAGPDPQALIRLSAEVAHAVNNPLQVLSLWAEAPPQPRQPAPDPALRETVVRIRDVVKLLGAHGRLKAPVRQAVDLGRLLRVALEAASAGGGVRAAPPLPPDGPEAPADPLQLHEALSVLCSCLGALAPAPPLLLRARVLPSTEVAEPHKLQILALGLVVPAADLEALPTLVLASHPETRAPHPGLALPAAVAALHGGSLTLKQVKRGLLVTLSLPS